MPKRALSVYRKKRDFTKTAEPSGAHKVASSRRLRFVVQKHAARRLHYDLRLEWQGVFKSWAVTRGPSMDPADKRLAVEVEDHPLDYGDFEGTIPAGEYGGGTVQLWDRGFWKPEGPLPVQAALDKGDFKFTLDGSRLHGSWVLVRMRGDRFSGKRNNWLLIKHRDAAAKPGDADALLEEDRSVASGRSMQQIAAGKGKQPKPFMLAGAVPQPEPVMAAAMPKFVQPQLCTLSDRPPGSSNWVHEIKLDGYRAQLRVAGGRAELRTRKGLDWTDRFAAIAKAARGLPDCLIDGEVVALDKKRLPSFSALQAALSQHKSDELVYYAFDLLFEGREDLRSLPLGERKNRLESLLKGVDLGGRISYVAHLDSDADAVLASARKMGLEGIVSKKLDAAYRSGRTESWVKTKCRPGQEVVLGGWTTEGGSVRSLLAGVYRGGRLAYIGRIGTGFGRSVATLLLKRLTALTRETSPFEGENAPRKEANVRWLKPTLVAEIEFAGWTGAGMIREAAFKGLREDKDSKDVVAETGASASRAREPRAAAAAMATVKATAKAPARAATKVRTKAAPNAASAAGTSVMGVTISHPDKVLWPDAGGSPVTKLDLAHYFEQVGEWMMPHLAGRPCSLVRAPNGINGQRFFQRHAMPGMSALLDSVKVRGERAAYVQIDRVEGLAAVAQSGTLELHPWNCAPNDPEVAGRLVFDLDPAPDVKFAAVIEAALEVRERLSNVGLVSFCKTTGGKGLHVVTPLTTGKAAVKWPVAKNFAHLLCAQMAQDSPRRYLDNMSKSQRTGRIFLDYLRNDRMATAVAVLSPRAREGAPVSMPVDWREVKKGLVPQAFSTRIAPGLLARAKPWKDYAQGARSLADAIKRITRAATKPKRR
jgi:bifunctional non-homologous end joining protein LigD